MEPFPNVGTRLPVYRVPADPAWFKDLMAVAKLVEVRVPNLYGYDRAYTHHPAQTSTPKTVLDPTAGGGSIPFEAMRLGLPTICQGPERDFYRSIRTFCPRLAS